MSTDVFRIKRQTLIEKIRATYNDSKRDEKEYEDAVEYLKSEATSALKSRMQDLEPNINIWGLDTIEIEYRMSLTDLGFTMPERPEKRYGTDEYAAMLQAISVLELSDSEYISQTVANKFLKFV
ncbi:hypothetical protein UFOVP621_85 [uncultured Caudovirales phage]|uniref:Uncharacterized protein n=1 Tax=uncultured Caudovirales phage TaxID=2100421 RepID=A0A6J5NCW3_9CAUD|nr:hypothetical protein UFOVP621_85 [uncultured Caudovirales phage]